MNEWQVVIVLGACLTFFVGTMLPLLKILIKTNSTIEGNTRTIENVNNTMQETIKLNKEEHDHFFRSINTLNSKVAVLEEKHRND